MYIMSGSIHFIIKVNFLLSQGRIILLYECMHATSSLRFLLLDIWVVFISWLLWIILLWIWGYKSFFQILISFPFIIYPEMGLLDHMAVLFFWLYPWHIEVPRPEVEPVPQKGPEPHSGTGSLTHWAIRELLAVLF